MSGHGEFFDRGDPIPKHATLTVSGVEDPLVECLELEKLLSAALSERARRQNDQVITGNPSPATNQQLSSRLSVSRVLIGKPIIPARSSGG